MTQIKKNHFLKQFLCQPKMQKEEKKLKVKRRKDRERGKVKECEIT